MNHFDSTAIGYIFVETQNSCSSRSSINFKSAAALWHWKKCKTSYKTIHFSSMHNSLNFSLFSVNVFACAPSFLHIPYLLIYSKRFHTASSPSFLLNGRNRKFSVLYSVFTFHVLYYFFQYFRFFLRKYQLILHLASIADLLIFRKPTYKIRPHKTEYLF